MPPLPSPPELASFEPPQAATPSASTALSAPGGEESGVATGPRIRTDRVRGPVATKLLKEASHLVLFTFLDWLTEQYRSAAG